MHTAPYGGAVQTTSKPARPSPLPEPNILNAETCKYHMCPNTTTNRLLPGVPLLTYAHRPTKVPRA